MDFSDVTRLFKEDLLKVEEAIKENYKSDVPLIPGISSYLMSCGGKRIRPLLVIISTELCGKKVDATAIKYGCAVEYIHAATLLHDDVVDETTIRRGHETVNSKWGSDASILVGDFLISRAILILAEACDPKVIRAIAESTKILVEGGILEFTHARRLDVTEEHILDVIHRKTSSIMEVSCRLGALTAETGPEMESALVSFANNFGMAFQLMDDAMDYDADEEVLGKPPGTDFKEGHVTLPLLHLYIKGDRTTRKQIESFVKNENLTQKDLEYVVERMREEKSLEYTLDLARKYIERAKSSLGQVEFKSPEYLEAMNAVADYIVERHTTVKPCP